jgi:thymidylate kinase
MKGPALKTLIIAHEAFLEARIVRQSGLYFTLQCLKPKGLPEFVNIDFSHDAMYEGVCLASGETVLGKRHQRHNFWIPAAGDSFVIQALRLAFKQSFTASEAENLTSIFVGDPDGVKARVHSAWPANIAAGFMHAAEQASWIAFPALSKALQRHHLRLQWLERPFVMPQEGLKKTAARLRRLVSPPGVHVVFLGPDGAGKSTTIEGTAAVLKPLFSRSEVKGFAPPIAHLFRRAVTKKDTSKPHSLRQRGWLTSLLRAGYWMLNALLSHVTLRLAKARATLVLSDRHFLDILVDPVRYRYGGPSWALHLVDWLNPKPDLIILLHGRPEVLQARKREISVEATAALCAGYEKLVASHPQGRFVNAEQPSEAVIREVVENVLAVKGRD